MYLLIFSSNFWYFPAFWLSAVWGQQQLTVFSDFIQKLQVVKVCVWFYDGTIFASVQQTKPDSPPAPPSALCVLFIECGVVFSPKENVSPIHKQCNNFITFLWLTGLNRNLDIQTWQHVTNNESAFYFLVAAHTSTNKHMASGSLPAISLYPAFHSFIQIISTIFAQKIQKLRVSIMFCRSWKSYQLGGLCKDIYHPVTWHLWGRLLQQQSRSSVSTH